MPSVTRNRAGESARRRERCIALNLCLVCGRPRESELLLCASCRLKKASKRRGQPPKIKQQRSLAGLCVICGGHRDSSNKTCSICLAKKSQSRKQKRISNQADGLCLCGRPLKPGNAMCAKCQEKYRNDYYSRLRRCKESNRCPDCGRPTGDTVYCQRCTADVTAYIMRRYEARKRAGQCVMCGSELCNGETFRCAACKIAHTKRTIAKWNKTRRLVIGQYGDLCECCGESTLEFLELDHINGGGNKHRQEVGSRMMDWVIKNEFPEGFRVLCANCNRSMGKFGVCHHLAEPPEPISKRGRRLRRRRQEVIEHYGGKCACCGDSHWAFLEIDHLNNDGNIQRRSGLTFRPYEIIKRGFPTDLQLLCSNCNKAKGLYGTCPHVHTVEAADFQWRMQEQ